MWEYRTMFKKVWKFRRQFAILIIFVLLEKNGLMVKFSVKKCLRTLIGVSLNCTGLKRLRD